MKKTSFCVTLKEPTKKEREMSMNDPKKIGRLNVKTENQNNTYELDKETTKMVKTLLQILGKACFVLLLCITLSSCATVFGGRVTPYQKTKPTKEEPARRIRVAALVCDILLTPYCVGVPVDFLTGAIYRPEKKK